MRNFSATGDSVIIEKHRESLCVLYCIAKINYDFQTCFYFKNYGISITDLIVLKIWPLI